MVRVTGIVAAVIPVAVTLILLLCIPDGTDPMRQSTRETITLAGVTPEAALNRIHGPSSLTVAFQATPLVPAPMASDCG